MYVNIVINLFNRKSRWRHETNVCKLKPPPIDANITNIDNKTINNNNILSNNTNNLTANDNSTLVQNNIQNQTIHLTINKLGCEDISILSQEEIEEIINNGLNCVIKLIEFINFNEKNPQNHSFCTTNLNNKYASVLNTEKNEIEKHRKIDVFDKVLLYAFNHIDMLKDKITNKKIKKEFETKIKELESKIFGNIEYKKIFIEQLNALSYNNRTTITNTWDDYFKKLIISNL